jgi:hypothetical protein
MHFDDFDSVGSAAGNSRAACVHGAPIAMSSSHTPMVYVPDETVMRGFVRPATHHSPRGRAYPAQRMQSSGGTGAWAALPPRMPGRHFNQQQTISGQPQSQLSPQPNRHP